MPEFKAWPCDVCDGTGNCPECDGTGLEHGKTAGPPCEHCGGSGDCQACGGSGNLAEETED
jgi:primosomal protein N'